MTAETLQTVDAFWASYFGCDVDSLYRPEVAVVPHAALGDYSGAFLFRRGPSCIISVPPALPGPTQRALRDRAPEAVFATVFLEELFGDEIDRIIGPAWLGYADTADLRPSRNHQTRLLNPQDQAALRRLAHECGETEWEHSGIHFDRPPVAACFLESQIAAAAAYEIWGDRLAHICVITHPAHRGQGFGKAVVSGIAGHALQQNLIAQYRTLQSNTPSVGIARSVGFQEYAATIAVRLRPR